jgi:hypothetical protein
MANAPTTLHLKVDVDNTHAAELAPRLKTAIHDALTAADRMGVDDAAGAAAYAVVVEIFRVRQATPAEVAIARVRSLHHDWEADPGHCAHCTGPDGNLVRSPCPTIRALNGPPVAS